VRFLLLNITKRWLTYKFKKLIGGGRIIKEEKENPLGIKQWISKTVLSTLMFLIIIYAFETFVKIPILTQIIVIITVIFVFGFAHEALHYAEAIKLGYEPVWWRTKARMGFNITSHSSKKKYLEDKKKIALAPYYVLLPISVILLFVGYAIDSIGLLVGSLGVLIMHFYSLTKEGVEV